MILSALQANPDGLSTVELAAVLGGMLPSDCWTILRYHETRGRVVRPYPPVRGVADVWRLTPPPR